MKGALCEECDLKAEFWDEGFSNSAPFVCDKCSNVDGNFVKIALMNVFILVNMVMAVKVAGHINKSTL